MKNLKDEGMGVYQVHAALVFAGCHSIVTRGNWGRGATSWDAIIIPGPTHSGLSSPGFMLRDQFTGDRELESFPN
jgi:hypothetical protein